MALSIGLLEHHVLASRLSKPWFMYRSIKLCCMIGHPLGAHRCNCRRFFWNLKSDRQQWFFAIHFKRFLWTVYGVLHNLEKAHWWVKISCNRLSRMFHFWWTFTLLLNKCNDAEFINVKDEDNDGEMRIKLSTFRWFKNLVATLQNM